MKDSEKKEVIKQLDIWIHESEMAHTCTPLQLYMRTIEEMKRLKERLNRKPIEDEYEEKHSSTYTFGDLYHIFLERYKVDESKMINDFRPAPFSREDCKRVGLKLWMNNGDEFIFMPRELKEEAQNE